MPRRSRIDAAGALHHVMVRGIERGVVRREVSSDCRGPESFVLLGVEGTGGSYVFAVAQAGDIDPVCQ